MSFQSMTVPVLKSYLTARGIPITGYTKQHLIRLATEAERFYDPLEPDDEVKGDTIQVDGVTVTESHSSTLIWTPNLTHMPVVKTGAVFSFLIERCEWTSTRIANFDKDDGYRLFSESHIESVRLAFMPNSQMVYVKGQCKPEQRQSADPYRVWLLTTPDGKVKLAGCDCVGGSAGSCKHVVCLLFSIQDYHERHRDRGTQACTDRQQVWDKPRKESHPVKAQDIDYRHDQSVPPPIQPCPPDYFPIQPISNADILHLRQKMKIVCENSKPDALFLSMLPDQKEKENNLTIIEMARKYITRSHNESFMAFVSENTTENDRKYLSMLDQNSNDYLDHKFGRITASFMSRVLSFNLSAATLNHGLVSDILKAPMRSSFMPASLDHGVKYEPVARAQYISEQKFCHTKLKVDECGLFLSEENACLGASPDGIVTCSCHQRRPLEIKCSFKHCNISPEQIPHVDGKYHVFINNGKLDLKRKSPWYFQAQFQMGILGARSCDFVLHTLQGICIMEIAFDFQVFEELFNKAELIYTDFVTPKLLASIQSTNQ